MSVNWADSTKHNSPQPLTLPKELGQYKRSYDFKEYGRFKSYEVIHNVRKNKFELTSPTNKSLFYLSFLVQLFFNEIIPLNCRSLTNFNWNSLMKQIMQYLHEISPKARNESSNSCNGKFEIGCWIP